MQMFTITFWDGEKQKLIYLKMWKIEISCFALKTHYVCFEVFIWITY